MPFAEAPILQPIDDRSRLKFFNPCGTTLRTASSQSVLPYLGMGPKMGTTANQKKLFFNLRKAKSKISALEEGDLRPDQVKLIAKRLGVTEQDVVDMNRRLSGDVSLNAPIRDDGDSGEWQDWLVDEVSNQETRLVKDEESDKASGSGPPFSFRA